MPSINMIAARRAEKLRQENNIRRLLYGVATETGVALVIISTLMVHLAAVSGNVDQLKGEKTRLQPTVQKIQEMQKEISEMQPKVATLQGARNDTMFWYNGFYTVTACLPTQSWLTSLSTAGNTTNDVPGTIGSSDPQLNLSGIALNQSQVGSTILRMNQMANLDHVDLASIQAQKTGQTDTVTYQMTVHLKPEAPPTDAAPTSGGQANA